MRHVVNIKYRTWFKGLPPRPIKLEVPGWGGSRHSASAQPWQCKPFVDGATYGLELLYPFETPVTVTATNGKCVFECESKSEWEVPGGKFPFDNFAHNHFGFTSSLDIQTEPGFGLMILPHPRYFTDTTGEVPLPSIGMIEADWWPKIFFIAFRAPLANGKYVFRKGDGVAQVLIVPKNVQYNIQAMTPDEIRKRNHEDVMLTKYASNIATRKWKDGDGNVFDNKYKVLSAAAAKCPHAVRDFLNDCPRLSKEEMKKRSRDMNLGCYFVRPRK